ncbi:MAG: hypothetical protein P1U56_25920 [Saprospiraceae bacterium]|nr:hypothetical protein [Saprospiraceae bacterium]
MNAKFHISVLGFLGLFCSFLISVDVVGQQEYVLSKKQTEKNIFLVNNANEDLVVKFKIEYGEKDKPYTIVTTRLLEIKKNIYSSNLKIANNQNETISSFKRSTQSSNVVYLVIPKTVNPGIYESGILMALDTVELKGSDKKNFHSAYWKIGIEIIDTSQFKIIASPSSKFLSSGDMQDSSRFFLPSSKVQDGILFEVQNTSDTTIQFGSIELQLINKKNNDKLTAKDVLNENTSVLAVMDSTIESSAVLASNLDIRPGLYEGKIFLKSNLIEVSKDIKMQFRAEPGWALFWLLLGLFIGFIARRVDETKTHGQLLKYLANCEIKITDLPDDKKASFQKRIDELREEINITIGSKHLERIEQDIDKLYTVIRDAKNSSISSLADMKSQVSAEKLSLSSRFRKTISPEMAQVWYKPFVYLLFLAASVLFAFYFLYLEQPTFGEDGIYDYAKLFLTGVAIILVTRDVVFNSWIGKFISGIGFRPLRTKN